MRISNTDAYYEDSIAGQPQVKYGVGAVDGDAAPFVSMPIGSKYIRNGAGFVHEYMKLQNKGADQDWALLSGCLMETLALADFTDSTGVTGTYTMVGDIPIGAEVTRVDLRKITGFAGDTSATIQVGVAGTVARYTTATPSVFATAEMVDAGAVSGTAIHTAAASPLITITANSDWGSVSAGKVTVAIWFNGVC